MANKILERKTFKSCRLYLFSTNQSGEIWQEMLSELNYEKFSQILVDLNQLKLNRSVKMITCYQTLLAIVYVSNERWFLKYLFNFENSYLITPGELRVIGAGSRWRTVHRWTRCWGRHQWKHSSRANIVKFCKRFNGLKKNGEIYLDELGQSPLKAARWSRSFRRQVGKYSDRWKVTC